jgi:hypothetical protein
LSGCINKQNLQNEVTAITKENGKYCSFLEWNKILNKIYVAFFIYVPKPGDHSAGPCTSSDSLLTIFSFHASAGVTILALFDIILIPLHSDGFLEFPPELDMCYQTFCLCDLHICSPNSFFSLSAFCTLAAKGANLLVTALLRLVACLTTCLSFCFIFLFIFSLSH